MTVLGPIACAGVDGFDVNALAVDRTGAVYLALGEERIQRLDTTTLECDPPLLVPDGPLPGPSTFPAGYAPTGLAFVGDGMGDVLYGSFFGQTFLLTIDVESGALQLTPDSPTTVTGRQLAGTGSGRLFVVGEDILTDGQVVVQVAPRTGTVVATYPPLPGVYAIDPIAVWNGDIYYFPEASVTVTDAGDFYGINRLRPGDGTNVTVGMVEGEVVAANASTCAPNP